MQGTPKARLICRLQLFRLTLRLLQVINPGLRPSSGAPDVSKFRIGRMDAAAATCGLAAVVHVHALICTQYFNLPNTECRPCIHQIHQLLQYFVSFSMAHSFRFPNEVMMAWFD
jgi:hypothetical protein